MLSMAGSAAMLLLLSGFGKALLLEMASIPLPRTGFSFLALFALCPKRKKCKEKQQKSIFFPLR
jgi:hypothetical protein